jgi:hypothetical protein
MTVQLRDLDARTRTFMLDELHHDRRTGRTPTSAWLRDGTLPLFLDLLQLSFEQDDPTTLAAVLRAERLLNSYEVRRTTRGDVVARLPRSAAQQLAFDTFNHYYIRGVCRRALRYGLPAVVVDRSREVRTARPASEALVGLCIGAHALLADLRSGDPQLGVPGGPGSALTVRLPRERDGVLGIPLLAPVWGDDELHWAA